MLLVAVVFVLLLQDLGVARFPRRAPICSERNRVRFELFFYREVRGQDAAEWCPEIDVWLLDYDRPSRDDLRFFVCFGKITRVASVERVRSWRKTKLWMCWIPRWKRQSLFRRQTRVSWMEWGNSINGGETVFQVEIQWRCNNNAPDLWVKKIIIVTCIYYYCNLYIFVAA